MAKEITTKSILITLIEFKQYTQIPEFNKRVILITKKGQTTGKLISFDITGCNWKWDDNESYYSHNNEVLYYADIPEFAK